MTGNKVKEAASIDKSSESLASSGEITVGRKMTEMSSDMDYPV